MATYEIKDISFDDEVGRIIKRDIFDEFKEGFITIGKNDTCMPKCYLRIVDDIKTMEIRESDIIVASYPKCGTTWLQEMVWMIANDLDYKRGEIELNYRFPFLELSGLNNYKKMKTMNIEFPDCISDSLEYTKAQEDPRFIKTHLPFSLLPEQIQNGSKTPKIVYVMRNPKDALISYFHHGQLMSGWRTNLEDFAKVFLVGKVMHGSYWKNVLDYWERRNLPNLLIVTYEDMKADIASVIKKVAKFLGKELSDEQIISLSKHLSFEVMKNNRAVNKEGIIEKRRENNLTTGKGSFLRSGTVGKYKEEMSQKMIDEVNRWNKENIKGTIFEEEYPYLLS